jgi:hypothetical protein
MHAIAFAAERLFGKVAVNGNRNLGGDAFQERQRLGFRLEIVCESEGKKPEPARSVRERHKRYAAEPLFQCLLDHIGS